MKRLLQLSLLVLALAWCLPARADITKVGSTSSLIASTTADLTITLPSGVTTNDIIFISRWSRSQSDTLTITGYTQVDTVDTGASRHWVFWKRAGASESNPVCDFSASANHYGRAVVFRGVVITGNPWNAISSYVADNGTTDPTTFTGVTTGAANSMVLVIDSYQDNDSSVAVVTGTDPSAYTEDYQETATGNDGSIEFSHAVRTSAGATDNISINYGTITSRADGADDSGDVAVLILSLDPCPTCITYSFVQSTNSSCSSCVSDPTSYVSNVTAGNLGIAWHGHESASGTHITTVTDSRGDNTWRDCADGTSTSAPDRPEGSGANRYLACMWTVFQSSGAMTVTAVSTDCSVSCPFTGITLEEFNLGSTPQWVAYAENTNATSGTGTNNATCGSITPTSGFTVLLACGANHAGTGTAGTSPLAMTMRETATTRAEDAQWTASGSVNPTMSISNSTAYVTQVVGFCGGGGCSAGSGAASSPTMMLMGVGD